MQKDTSQDWLVPRFGTNALEKAFYETLVMNAPPNMAMQTKRLEEAPYLFDPLKIISGDLDFDSVTSITTGYKLTFSQEWYSHGVALGQLLHSVTLSPGESVRIVMANRSRQLSGQKNESINESESLTNNTARHRSINEVVNAVMSETKRGFSHFNNHSTSSSNGGSSGGSFFGLFGGGSSNSTSTNRSKTWGFTRSAGNRSLGASLQQNIMDSTQQHATAVRDRWAMVVEEVTDKKMKNITTRVITNYNHMHALSMHYYEVVQIYKVRAGLISVDSCLFIPFKKIKFSQHPESIYNMRYKLIPYILDVNVKEIMLEDNKKRFSETIITSHFEANEDFYNNVIFNQIDNTLLIRMLSRYKYNDRPLIELIDPIPLAVIDNLLVFRQGSLHKNQPAVENVELLLSKFMLEHGLDFNETEEREIALPSEGVHAEGILSQSNCAEKIDLTRNWDWQEMPIPILPTQINPVDASYIPSQPTNIKPGHFTDPALHISAPQSLPQPAGNEATLRGMAQSNAFRDANGSSFAANLAQSGLQQVAMSDQNSAQEAGRALEIAMRAQRAMRDRVESAAIGGLTGGATMEGGMLNLARNIDANGGPRQQEVFRQALLGSPGAIAHSITEQSHPMNI